MGEDKGLMTWTQIAFSKRFSVVVVWAVTLAWGEVVVGMEDMEDNTSSSQEPTPGLRASPSSSAKTVWGPGMVCGYSAIVIELTVL